jgi:hypothetical protein
MNYSFIANLTHPDTELDFSADVTIADSETLIVESVWNMDTQSEMRISAELIEQVRDRLAEHIKNENHARNYARGEDMALAKARGDFY